MSITRVALVSATGTGRKRLLPALRGSAICRVTAAHGRDQAKVERLAAEFGVDHAYDSLKQMIAEAEFDVAVVCSPPFLHLEQVQMLASAGIPTLCEKPLAITEADAQAIRGVAEQSEALIMVAHQSRHQNTYSEIKAALASGEIGEARSAFMEWSFTLDPVAPNAWWKRDPALNGPSCLTDAGIHCFDAAIGLFGPGTVTGASSPGRSASGVFETCDVLSLHGGVEVAVRASRLYGPHSNMLVISGTKGEIQAPRFFTEASAPIVRIDGVDGTRTIERLPGNAYREEMEDFVRAAFEPGHVSVGTSLEEAVTACRMLDEAHALLLLGAPPYPYEQQ